jgi:hypothetical protein
MQSDANQSLSKLPDQQGKCREWCLFKSIHSIYRTEKSAPSLAFYENSLEIGAGNFDRRSGNSNSLIDF